VADFADLNIQQTPNGYSINGVDYNYQQWGTVNSGYNATNLNVNAIPGQNQNTWADPNSGAPNFNGNVTVDTASLSAFGSWVANELTHPLQQLKPKLQGVQVEPGSFYWADYIRSYVNGTSPTTGLKNQFLTVVEDLLDGLAGISHGVNQLVQQYSNTEDLNNAQASQLSSDMSNSFGTASTAFNTLGSAGQTSGSSGG